MTEYFRIHGEAPYSIAALHGGPGAPGSMSYLCEQLSSQFNILEPYQTANSIKGQVAELHSILEKFAPFPITLIGWSWGAWLGWLYAARHPEYVKHLILISSGPFEAHYAQSIDKTRFNRLDLQEKGELTALQNKLSDPAIPDKTAFFQRFGKLYGKADSYAPLGISSGTIDVQHHIFNTIWSQADEMRRNGELLAAASDIRCPVTAIHGDYDPHPWQGVKEPLEQILSDFSFHLLKKCGHEPWDEKYAQQDFFNLLRQILKGGHFHQSKRF